MCRTAEWVYFDSFLFEEKNLLKIEISTQTLERKQNFPFARYKIHRSLSSKVNYNEVPPRDEMMTIERVCTCNVHPYGMDYIYSY